MLDLLAKILLLNLHNCLKYVHYAVRIIREVEDLVWIMEAGNGSGYCFWTFYCMRKYHVHDV